MEIELEFWNYRTSYEERPSQWHSICCTLDSIRDQLVWTVCLHFFRSHSYLPVFHFLLHFHQCGVLIVLAKQWALKQNVLLNQHWIRTWPSAQFVATFSIIPWKWVETSQSSSQSTASSIACRFHFIVHSSYPLLVFWYSFRTANMSFAWLVCGNGSTPGWKCARWIASPWCRRLSPRIAHCKWFWIAHAYIALLSTEDARSCLG